MLMFLHSANVEVLPIIPHAINKQYKVILVTVLIL